MKGDSSLFEVILPGFLALGRAVEIVGRALAGAIASDADGSFRLPKYHVVSVQLDVIDAKQDDGLAVVTFVKPLREFDSLIRFAVGESLRVGPFQVEPEGGDVRGVEVESAVLAGEVRRGSVRGGFTVDGNGGIHLEFVHYPETIDRSAEILVRVQRLAGCEGKSRTEGEKGNADDSSQTLPKVPFSQERG